MAIAAKIIGHILVDPVPGRPTRMARKRRILVAGAVGLALAASKAGAQDRSWLNLSLPPEVRADLALQAMTLDEKIRIVHGSFGFSFQGKPKPEGALGSAGYVPGVPRLGIPALQESDAGLGVANPEQTRAGDEATPLPSGLSIAATFDPALAERAGAMIGAEARAKGFNVLLAGGANLAREPRNGRNFEYAGEDPLLAGMMVGAAIRGIQQNRIISTVKHFALNDQETGRESHSANIAEAAARESDLLAFEIAIEQGKPHAVMCAYNKVNGTYACENDFLLNQVLKRDWKYPGFVMSDWGAVHSTEQAALAGLDQESGENLDRLVYFDAPLRAAVEAGRVSPARLDDMVRRILRAMFASGVIDDPPQTGGAIDYTAHAELAHAIAEQGLVLLRNKHALLPLAKNLKHILVVGSHADKGVLSGGGSSQVIPVGGIAVPGLGPKEFPGPMVYDPSAPLAAIAAEAGGAEVDYLDGGNVEAAARAVRGADAVIVFAHQWMAEMRDAENLSLPDDQDRLIAALAAANPRTIVVLETGGPVKMPWLSHVPAVIAAWYPGARGAEAIAGVLFGRVNPSGRLPVTFPQDEAQLPRPHVSAGAEVNYFEGAEVGYKWFDRRRPPPLFPFGHGLSYTTFALRHLAATFAGPVLTVSLQATNTGAREGIATPQIYLRCPGIDGLALRLVGWSRLKLAPGETRRATIAVDPRLMARFDAAADAWRISARHCILAAGASARDLPLTTKVTLPATWMPP
jgi:beta-glucosidase